jgi:hypothetical protein
MSVPPDLQAYVSPTAAGQIGPDGRFLLATPRAPDDIAIITPDRARELAIAFLHTWGHSHADVWKHQRGSAINPGSLQLIDRVYFARSPHGRFPDGHHGAYRRMLGPWYVLHFTDGREAVLAVAISAYSTDLEIRNGAIRQPAEGGTYFMTSAVAATSAVRGPYYPVTPEDAVALAGKLTGARIDAAPELVLRAGWHPVMSAWKLTLDRPVSVTRKNVRGTSAPGERVATREIYVGSGNVLLIPVHAQPAGTRMLTENLPGRSAATLNVPRRGELPVAFDEVTVADEGR